MIHRVQLENVGHISGCDAEFEQELIRERIIAGLERAKAHNVRLGRKPTDLDMGKAIALRKQGLSYRKIATIVNSNKSTIQRAVAPILNERNHN